MTKTELISKIEAYFTLVSPLYAIIYGNKPDGTIIQLLTQPTTTYDSRWVEIKAIIQTNQRAVTYPTTDSRDEGWRMEQGTFYEERTIKLPLFALDESLSDDDILYKLYKLNQDSKIADLKNSIEHQTRILKLKTDELDELINTTEYTISIGDRGGFKVIPKV